MFDSQCLRKKPTSPYLRIVVAFLFFAMTGQGNAHPGGKDVHGGHKQKNTGIYHCHTESCSRQNKMADVAYEEAVVEQRNFVAIYNREDWPHWSDSDHDCMNTRHEMLLSQAKGHVKKSPDGCYVSMAKWVDPYSGVVFTRASMLDVDHVVPLKWAHTHGGALWTRHQKETFANDSLNLLVVDKQLNQAKGTLGPDRWLPPNSAFFCEYLKRWKQVLTKYPELSLTPKEDKSFKALSSKCHV